MDQENVIRLDLPATYKYLNVLGSCLSALLERVHGLTERQSLAYNLELAVHEACTNVVEHAYADQKDGRLKVTMGLDPHKHCLIIELHDTGESFDLSAAPEPDLDNPQVHGYGLFLIRQLVDEMEYRPSPGSNYWRLVKKLY